eukprot:maker-scaffold261_size233860-snap-gene-1.31 protein:Tk10690 transcript:maker-scaffold261_size233860-snap-gene-1.31-mRNA-1 annotation:"enhancer of mrna-decapping protein 4"
MDGSTFLASIMALRADTKQKPIHSETTHIVFNSEIDTFSIQGQSQVMVAPFDRGDHDLGSSQLQMRTLVNYAWDRPHYPGRLCGLDLSGRFLAYAILVRGLEAGPGGDGAVRVVIRRGLGGIDQRQSVLIKGMKGQVQDVAFAHHRDPEQRNQVTLGCVDAAGQVFIYRIQETTDGQLKYQLILQINQSRSLKPAEHHRFIWCPYLPEDDEDMEESSAHLFVAIHGDTAEMIHTNMVINAYGLGTFNSSDLKEGRLVVREEGRIIMDAAFSPDGTALATASTVGLAIAPGPRIINSMDGSTFLASIMALRADTKQKPIHSETTHIVFNSEIDTFSIQGQSQVMVAPFDRGDHDLGSSQLQMRTLVNYAWDRPHYPGRLCGLDLSGRFLAYAILVRGLEAGPGGDGAVRVVIRRGLGGIDQRQSVLIKGMKGQVQDVAFAHHRDPEQRNQVTLGCVDAAGQVFIYRIQETTDGQLKYQLILQINQSRSLKPAEHHRFIWCPYLPEDDEDMEESSAHLFVAIHGDTAEMIHTNMVINAYGLGTFNSSDLKEGRLVVREEGRIIMDAAFSPDGTALATASSDGQVSFYQVYMPGNEAPRCLHNWSPHNGRALSGLFFLDDHQNYDPAVQFWKYLVTTSENHSHLKIWSCESWTCLQTIQYQPRPGQHFKAALDLSGTYLVLSDLGRKHLYVLKFQETNGRMSCVSASEFATPAPFLSMSIINAGKRKITVDHTISDDEDDSDDEDFDDQNEKITKEATVIDLVLVQPKSLQTCRVTFEEPTVVIMKTDPIKFETFDEDIIIPPAEVSLTDVKPDLSILQASLKAEALTSPLASSMIKPVPVEASESITLMSPEAFATHSITTKVKEEIVDDDILEDEVPLNSGRLAVSTRALRSSLFRSGNSSPSREVQGILDESEKNGGLGNDVVVTGDDFENEEDDEEDVEDDIDDVEEEDLPNLKDIPLPKVTIKSEWPQPPLKAEQAKLSQSFDMAFPAASNDTVLQKMNEMMALIQTQRSEMNRLRGEITATHQSERSATETMIAQSNKKLLEAIKRESKQKSDDMGAQMTKSIHSKLENLIKSELKKTTNAMIQQIIQQVQQTLQQDLHQRAGRNEVALKDAVAKMGQSKSLCDHIGHSVSNSIAPLLQTTFKDAFANAIIPSFEKSIQTMMVHINTTFMKGIKEHEMKLNSHMSKLRMEQQSNILDPLVKELRGAMGNVDHIVNSVKSAVAFEVNEAFAMSPMRSGTATPSASGSGTGNSVVDTQRAIQAHLTEGKLNEAFQTALSASNLGLVVLTCEMVNPMQVFAQAPCPLSQHVLLALIQQLGHNLDEKTELKHKYLEEAVMNLDTLDVDTKTHLSSILSGLCKQLQSYVTRHPNQKMTKQMKLLLMAAHHLVGK